MVRMAEALLECWVPITAVGQLILPDVLACSQTGVSHYCYAHRYYIHILYIYIYYIYIWNLFSNMCVIAEIPLDFLVSIGGHP